MLSRANASDAKENEKDAELCEINLKLNAENVWAKLAEKLKQFEGKDEW
ncbi:MAG: hypothetical protein AAF609_26630 [Cyanobacteria bacterium P01_C01_bin.120]